MKVKVANQRRFALVMVSGLLMSIPAHSSLNAELADFYNSMSGKAAATPPSVYQGQSAYYVTFGGLNARSPVRNYSLVSLSMPSIKSGCGGIDIYSGGFSFINADAFVEMLKNIGSNAIGFAFQLALDVISPQISDNIKQLMSKIENIANMNINSCEAAQQLVGGIMKATDLQKSYCNNVARSTGKASDASAARRLCSEDASIKDIFDTEKAKTDKASQDARKTVSGNLVWEGLKRRGLDPTNDKDRALMELVMSLTGTLIIPPHNSEQDAHGVTIGRGYKVGELSFEHLVYPKNAVGTVPTILRCAGAGVDECMNVVTVSVANPDTIYQMVSNRVDNIVSYIKTGAPSLTSAELSLIGMVQVPVFSLMQAAADVSQATLDAVAVSVKDLAAAEVAYALISNAVNLGLEALAASPVSVIDQGDKDMFVERAKLVRQEAFEHVNNERIKMGGVHSVMRYTNYLRTEAMNKFAPNLQRRIALARALTIQR